MIAPLLAASLLLAGCGGAANHITGPSPSPTPTPTPASQIQHVVIVVEENHSYTDVIGNPQMPYLNGLAAKYSLATQYFANTHPSIGNYFMLTTGQIITNDDSAVPSVTQDNIVRELVAAGKTWKSYAENLPQPGYLGPDAYPYVQHHNPFTYFSDVTGNPAQQTNLVPFTQFAADLRNGQLPNFSFIAPNLLNDAHDGTLQQADTWLKTNIDPLISNPAFQQSGLLIVVFDESEVFDLILGGGHVAAVLVGPTVKTGFQSTATYQHQSTLRMVLEKLGLSVFPGASATAPEMTEFFAK